MNDGFECRVVTLRASLWAELDASPLIRTYSPDQLLARALSTFLYKERERAKKRTVQEMIEDEAYENSK